MQSPGLYTAKEKGSVAGCTGRSNHFFQPKLAINQPNDVYEQEADAVANNVMQMPDVSVNNHSFFKPAVSTVQRKCQQCEEEEKQVQRKESKEAPIASSQTENYVHTLSGGSPLHKNERSFFESRMNYDFSNVRLHTDQVAAKSAQSVSALAYTSGNNIVFNEGQYQPGTESGKRLLAHELTHVIQQKNTDAIQRCHDDAANKAYDEKSGKVKGTEAYKKLGDKSVANKIVTDAKKKDDCIFYIDKLQLLFDTPVATAKETTDEFQAETGDAVAQEEQRLSVPEQQANTGLEEAASASPDRNWTPRKGKFGGGIYYVDNHDPNDIVVKAKVFLVKKGTGTDNDVSSIISMEDAIEKAASTQGYLVDIDFVKTTEKGAFTAFVDPSQWETATNWSGGDPLGFAHELHHMFAFPLDRYNYTDHATNKRMKITDRLHWFAEELKKPAGYNNPDSIMASGEHPIDDDVCTVAGLDVSKCVTKRQNTRTVASIRQKAFSLCFKARNILTGIMPASPFDKPNEPSQNDMNKKSAASIATSLFGNVSIDQVADLVTQMQYRLSPGLLITLAETINTECSSKETFLSNGRPPLTICSQFFSLPESEQVNIMLMEAARMVKLSDRSAETACASADCHTACGGFNNAADWAKFINCVSNI